MLKLGSNNNASSGFIVQTHSNYEQHVSDTFFAIVNVNLNADPPMFDYQYFRADGGDTWGQDPMLDFLVFDTRDASYSQLVAGQQTGSVHVDRPAVGASTSAQIAFPQAFGNDKPMLFASVHNSKCDGSQFAATIRR